MKGEFWAMEPLRFQALLELHSRPATLEASFPLNKPSKPERSGKVGIINLIGTLTKGEGFWFGGTSTIQVRRELSEAVNDPNIKAIVLAIDSPGGTVAGTQDLADDVRAASKRKTVVAHIDDLGASAAYWIASQASAVYANATTAMIGSIGTIMTLYDSSAAAEKQGIKPVIISTGPLKSTGFPGTKVTDKQIAYLQGLANDMQADFDTAVREGRKKMKSANFERVRTGEVFTARTALELGLIDGIQPLGETLRELRG